MLKKIWFLCFFTAVIGMMTQFNGCSSQDGGTVENKLVVWHWMTDRQDAFEELANQYESEKGIKIEFKLFFPPDIYSQKVIAAARAGNLPDIFGILGEKKTTASFIQGGYILALTTYMEENAAEWKRRFYPETLAVTTFKEKNIYNVDPGIYGVPIDTTLMQFVYNKALIEKVGLDPQKYPVTFQDFLNYAAKVKNTLDVDGFVCGWGEGWLLNAMATEWAINLMGMEDYIKTIQGEILYTDPRWIEIFDLFSRLRGAGILADNIATMTNKEAEDAFAKGKAVFSFNGSWAVNVYQQLSPELDFVFFPMPKISNEYPIKIWGGAGSSFMINAKSPNVEKAVDFLKWMTSHQQQKFLIRETNNLPAIRGCEESLPEALQGLVNMFGSLTHPNTWPQNEDSRVIEVINRGLQQIVNGINTPEKVAAEIQRTKERITRR